MVWRGGRVVECTALEMRHTGNRIGGSNPSLSANLSLERALFWRDIEPPDLSRSLLLSLPSYSSRPSLRSSEYGPPPRSAMAKHNNPTAAHIRSRVASN